MTLLVLGDPSDRRLAMLDRLPADVRIAAGNTPQALESAAPAADAILAWFANRDLLRAVWKMAPNVRWVHASSAGVDTLLFPELAASPVPLTNARGVYSGALGEFALAGMLFFAKGLRRMLRSQAEGRWDPFDVEMLHGKVLGIIGYGSIGHAVAERAKPFGMRILAVRREPELHEKDPFLEAAYSTEDRKVMIERCDYVVLAAPLTEETRGLMGATEIAAMKGEAVLVNIGRGPVVDETALIRALEQKRIRGAVLDVFEREPLPAGHPFYQLDNVLLSPHCADHTAGWLDQSMEFFLENFERFRRGEPLRNVVDKHAGY